MPSVHSHLPPPWVDLAPKPSHQTATSPSQGSNRSSDRAASSSDQGNSNSNTPTHGGSNSSSNRGHHGGSNSRSLNHPDGGGLWNKQDLTSYSPTERSGFRPGDKTTGLGTPSPLPGGPGVESSKGKNQVHVMQVTE